MFSANRSSLLLTMLYLSMNYWFTKYYWFTEKVMILITFGRNMTEFQVIHHFKALKMPISLIYWTCGFKVVCSFDLLYISKSCPLLAAKKQNFELLFGEN